ncbi:hypothetical protein JCM10213_001814 [Rhodosporidiobolus nylandii]
MAEQLVDGSHASNTPAQPTQSNPSEAVSSSMLPSTSSPRPSLSSTRALPARGAKARIGSLAEPFTKKGGERISVKQERGADAGWTGGRKRRKTEIKGDGRTFKRDEAGRFLSNGGRKRAKKESKRVEGEVIPVEALEDEEKSRGFGSVTIATYGQTREGYSLEADSLAAVRVGDIVQVLQAGTYAHVEKICALREDLQPTPNFVEDKLAYSPGDGKRVKPSTATAYLKISYLWKKSDFETWENDPDGAWVKQAHVLGPNELVKTDHSDVKSDRGVVKAAKDSIVYCFDDSYPAPTLGAHSPSPHPLSLFNLSDLTHLTPSSYALRALDAPSRHPPTKLDAHIPPFLFGVGAKAGSEGRGQELLDGGRAGRSGTPYVRVAFSFEPQLKHAEDSGSEEEESGGGSILTDRKGRKKSQKVWPLTLVRHSTSRRPYDPREVQLFSPDAKQWFSVDDLLAGEHYTSASSSSSETPATAAEKHLDPLDLTLSPPATSSGSSRFGSPADSDSSGSTFDFSGPSPPFADGATLTGASTSSGGVQGVLDQLFALASDSILRGGAYGLTGNAYLVTRAGELFRLLAHQPPPSDSSASTSGRSSLTAAQRSNAWAEANELLKSAKRWQKGVHERADGVGEGKGLGKEWKATGDPPKGRKWLCPWTGKEL